MAARSNVTRILRRAAVVVLVTLAVMVGGTAVRFRLAFGPVQTVVARVRYQFIDLGQGDLFRVYAEHWVGRERLWLDATDPRWIYVPRDVFRECWSGIRPGPDQTFTREVEFTVRRLVFGGYAPAGNIRVTQVPGPALITK